jgi:hypothetical protein
LLGGHSEYKVPDNHVYPSGPFRENPICGPSQDFP